MERERWYEELLGRDRFQLPREAGRSLASKRYLVTGGAGSIGSELVRRLRKLNPEKLIAFDNAEDRLYQLHRELACAGDDRTELVLGDVNSPRELRWILEKYRPDVVFHAAAHKHVDFLETQVLAAVRTNVFGTRNVLATSTAAGVETVVVLSSDKATNPVSVLGASKRAAELLVLMNASESQVSAVRLCNVLGTAGSLLPLVIEQARTGMVSITDNDADRYFVSPQEAADLLMSAASAGECGVLVPTEASRLNIHALVRRIIQDLGEGGKIRLEVTGLRAGEKLHEELYSEAEIVESATAAGLIKVSGPEFDGAAFFAALEALERAYFAGDESLVAEKLVNLVPEYRAAGRAPIPVSQ